MRADLHVHTTMSDGSDTFEDAPADHTRCAQLAERHNLSCTAGSDYHGRFGSIPHVGFRIPGV